MMKRVFLFVCVTGMIVFGATASPGQELGHLEFPNSGAAAAQPHFLKGMLLLHSFEYSDARDAFQEAEADDPDFAMAYWGEAMTYNHPIWQEVDLESARAALRKLGATPEDRQAKAGTEREKAYLATIEVLYGEGDKNARDFAYADAMKRLYEVYPEDLEAASFYALSLLGTCHQGRDFAVYMKAAGVLEEVFDKNPQHPGAIHYLIHSYDDPIHAPLGLRPARVYAKTAPAAAHAQHMPSHIFVALGMWDDVVSSNEVSWKVSDDRVKSRNLSVDERGFHALYWLQYGYLQQGRWKDALETLKIMEEDTKKSGSSRTRTHLARMRSSYVVEAESLSIPALPIQVDLSGLGVSSAGAYLFSSGYAAVRMGDLDAARRTLASMKDRREGSMKNEGNSHSGMSSYSGGASHDMNVAEIMEMELQGLILSAESKTDEAWKVVRKATEIEDALTFDFGPPEVVKPSHELLGELYLKQGKKDAAEKEFQQALQRYPRRIHSLLGVAQSGGGGKSESALRELEEILKQADANALESLGLNGLVHSKEAHKKE